MLKPPTMLNRLRRQQGAGTARHPLAANIQQGIAASGAALAQHWQADDAPDPDAALHRYIQRMAALTHEPVSGGMERAVRQAWEQVSRDTPARATLAALERLLLDQSRVAQQFRRMLIEEYLLRSQPDRGRLLDHYRRAVRHARHLPTDHLLPWTTLEPVLRHLFQVALPQAFSEQRELRWLLLDRREQAIIDALMLQAATHANQQHAADDLLYALANPLPLGQAITASEGSTITNAHIQQTIVVQREALPPPPDLLRLYHRYQSFILETFGALDFRGILQMKNVVRLRLEDVYIPLMAHRSVRLGTASDTPRKPRRWRVPGEEDLHAPAPLHHFIRDLPMVVVLGDPGSGKSTLVRAMLLALASGRGYAEFGLHDAWLPIFFPVAAYADARSRAGGHGLAPLDYLARYYSGLSQPDYLPLFLRALQAGHAMVLFDGMDEVRGDRLGLVRALEAFIREWDAPGNRFIATSRIAGYDDAPLDESLFPRVVIQHLSDAAIRLFIERWSSAFEQAGTHHRLSDALIAELELQRRIELRTRTLTAAVFTNSNVTELARNPLLLTILALIHHQGASLPDRRVDLYQVCVQALAETWHRARSLSGREVDLYLGNEKLDERFIVNLLGPAALWMQEHRPGGLIERDELEQQLAHTLTLTDGLPPGRARRTAQSFVDLMHYETGLLQERGYRRYGFMHLTFEEYLAARALLESVVVDNPDDIIHRRCTDPRWREVLRLTVSAASQREAQHLIRHMLSAPTTPDTAGRPVVLAGECLLDIGRNSATQQAWNAVITELLALLDNPQIALTSRLAGGLVLGELGDPRLLDIRTGTAPAAPYWCAVVPEEHGNLPYPFQIARLPVTNTEFERFVEAGSYRQQQWWTRAGWQFVQPGGHSEGNPAQSIMRPSHWDQPAFAAPNQPVVGVSWYEAAAYAAWLTDQGHRAGWLPANRVLRLPTSLEWQCAASGQDRRRYPWGDAIPTAEHANYDATATHAPSAVGCFPRGRAACGALDMAGNVWEWTCSHHAADRPNQVQPDFAPEQQPIIHGGAFNWSHEYLQISKHYWFSPAQRRNLVGFRLVQIDRSQLPKEVQP